MKHKWRKMKHKPSVVKTINKENFDPEEFRRLNNADRMWFVEYWAHYVKTHPDELWSRQQNLLINSLMQNAKNYKLSPKEYLKIKEEPCSRK